MVLKPHQVFSPLTWLLFVLFLLIFAVSFLVIHYVYLYAIPREYQLTTEKAAWFDFFILTMTKFPEPDPLPWFKKWSTGSATMLRSAILYSF